MRIIILPSLVRFGLIYKINSYLGIILLPLMMRFGLIYMTWAFQAVSAIGPWGERTGLPFWIGVGGPGFSMSFPFSWAWQVGLRAYFLNSISCPPAFGYGERGQRLCRFLNRVRLLRGRSGLVWLGLCRRQPYYGNDGFSTFTLTSSSSFSFF